MKDDMGASVPDRVLVPEGPETVPVSAHSGDAPSRVRRSLTIYEKPPPARQVLIDAGFTVDQAERCLKSLVEGGYGIGPREPTNGMLAGYLEATAPPRHHEAVITAIGKARVRWQAMLAHGTEMAMSRKFMGEAGSDT